MNKIFLLGCILVYCSATFSQTKNFTYYFDDNLKLVKKSKSSFTGLGTVEENLVALRIVDNKTNQAIILSHYTDSSLKVRQGPFQSFFSNGIKESEGNYEQSKENGLWKVWDDKGRLLDSTVFDNGKKVVHAEYKYYKKGSFSYKFEDFRNDRMREVFYNDSGKITTEATFLGNRGVLITYGKEDKKIDSVFSRVLIEASFPGGDAAWARYIRDVIVRNIDDITRDNQSGTCRLKFVIDKEGNVSNVEATTMKGTVLASVAKNALLNGPKWNPAIQYGRPVKAYREQPVTFTISNK